MQVTSSRPASIDDRGDVSVATRRFGYAVAVAVTLVMLVVANSLLGWGWPAFLTRAARTRHFRGLRKGRRRRTRG